MPGERARSAAPTRACDEAREGAGRRTRWLLWALPLALLSALIALYFAWPSYREFLTRAYELVSRGDEEAIRGWIQGYGALGYVVLLGLMLLQLVVPILPSIATMIAAVLAYGPWLGGALAWAGMMICAALAWGFGRLLGPVTVGKVLRPEKCRKLEAKVERYGAWAVVIARLSPILSTDAVSLAAGMGRMSFKKFMLATAVGTLPLIVLIAAFGAEIERLDTGLIVISVAGLVAWAAYVVWDHRRHKAEESAPRGGAVTSPS